MRVCTCVCVCVCVCAALMDWKHFTLAHSDFFSDTMCKIPWVTNTVYKSMISNKMVKKGYILECLVGTY